MSLFFPCSARAAKWISGSVFACYLSVAVPISAQDAVAKQSAPEVAFQTPEETNAAIDKAADKAISFLKNRGQAASGAFSPETRVAVTGLCVRAI